MAWYKTGSVTVTTGQTAVIGVGTSFVSNVRVGDGFRGPDGNWYEIVNIASETAIGIYPPYVDSTATSSNWMIAPLQGYNKESADRLRAITDSFPTLLDDKQNKSANLTSMSTLNGSADSLPYFTGAGALSLTALTAKARELNSQSNSAGMRNTLELGNSSTRNVTVGVVDTDKSKVMKPGDFGIGSTCVGLTDWNTTFIDHGCAFVQGNAVFPNGPGDSINATGINLKLNDGPIGGQLLIYSGDNQLWFRSAYLGWLPWVKVYHTGNTSRAADGTLKAN